MARLTIGQKCTRLLQFLIGLRNRPIAAKLARYGFDQAALDEGWKLLRQTAGERLDTMPTVEADQQLLVELDQWENHWFPIVSAVLKRHMPAVYERVFLNLSQTSGAEVVLSVSTLIERIDGLAREPGSGAEARALLEKHGLSKEVVDHARALIARTTRVSQGPVDVPTDDLERYEQAMWDYYLQWSAIARSAITDRRQLRLLGFLKSRRSDSKGADDVTADEVDDVAATNAGQDDAQPVVAGQGDAAADAPAS